MKGVDISNYQAGLDLIRAKSAGIEFAICKLSEGRTYKDRQFDTFYRQAEACGLPLGAYVYSHATTPDAAVAEANYALTLLNGRPLLLGVFMDIETETQMAVTKSQLAETVRAFCRTVEANGYRSGIYGSEYNLYTRIDPADFPNSLVWIAHYGKQPEIPCDLWQKTDRGQFPGFGGCVDADEVMSERMESLIRGEQPEPAPQPEPDHDKKPKNWDWKIALMQYMMKLDGYWDDEVDGLKSAKFFTAVERWIKDMQSC